MGIDIENDSFDEYWPLITLFKKGQIHQSGGTPSDQSGGHLSPGGECFAPFPGDHGKPLPHQLGAFPLEEGGCAKHSPTDETGDKCGYNHEKS